MDSPLLRLSELSDIDLDRLERLLVISSASHSPTEITTAPMLPLPSKDEDGNSICGSRQGLMDKGGMDGSNSFDTKNISHLDQQQYANIVANTRSFHRDEQLSSANLAIPTSDGMEQNAASPSVSRVNERSTSRYEDRLSHEQAHQYAAYLHLLHQQWNASIQQTARGLRRKMPLQESMNIATRRAGGHVLKAAKRLEQDLSGSDQQGGLASEGAYLHAIKQVWDVHGEHGDLKYLWQHVNDWEENKSYHEALDPFKAQLVIRRRFGSVEENQQSLIIEAIHDQKPTTSAPYISRSYSKEVIDAQGNVTKAQTILDGGLEVMHAARSVSSVAAAAQSSEMHPATSPPKRDIWTIANEALNPKTPTVPSAASTQSIAHVAADVVKPSKRRREASNLPNLMNEARLVSKPSSPSQQRLRDPTKNEISMQELLSNHSSPRASYGSTRQMSRPAKYLTVEHASRIPQLVRQPEMILNPRHTCLRTDEQGFRIRGHANAAKTVLMDSGNDFKTGEASRVSASSSLAPMTRQPARTLGARSGWDPREPSASPRSHARDTSQSYEIVAPAQRNRKSQTIKPKGCKRNRVPSLQINCTLARDQSPPKRARIVS